MKRPALLALLAAVAMASAVVAACVVKSAPPNSNVEVRDHRDGQPGTGHTGGTNGDPGAGDAAVPQDPPPPPKVADGGACSAAGDCASGVCEGMGCGPSAGVCVPVNRACTRDLVSYCGCDGQTFQASGSCPGRLYAAKGACAPPAPPQKVADGGSCSAGDECASGICEGEGCGPGAGKCMPAKRACTKDLRSYCGCDGQTFKASGSCAGRLYAAKGECKAAKKGADGAACLSGADCSSGICEGLGCDDKSPGKCVPKQRMCTADIRQMCDCSGNTFEGSSSCPGRRYSAKKACPAK